MSALVSGGSCICRSTPASRMAGARPTFRCRSEPLNFITIRKSLFASGSLGIASTGASTAVAMGCALLLLRWTREDWRTAECRAAS